jgi:hypothetical protein
LFSSDYRLSYILIVNAFILAHIDKTKNNVLFY